MRTAELLIEVAQAHPGAAQDAFGERPLLKSAAKAELSTVQEALTAEQRSEGQADRIYWQPLKQELEELRRRRETSK